MKNKTIKDGLYDGVKYLLLWGATFAALYLSYFMELIPYRSIFKGIDLVLFYNISITTLIAFTFNAAKLGLCWILAEHKVFGEKPFAATSIRSVLIVNSLIMAVFIVTGQFTAPNVEGVYKKHVSQVERSFNKQAINIERNHQRARTDLESRYTLRIDEIAKLYQPDMDKAQVGMDYEMNNSVNGDWYGSRYSEWKAKKEVAQAKLSTAMTEANTIYQTSLAELNSKFEEKQEGVERGRQQSLATESSEKYLDDFESQNKMITEFILLVNKFGIPIGPHHVILIVAMLITTIIEFIPLVLGGHLFFRIITKRHQKATKITQFSVFHGDSKTKKAEDDKVVPLEKKVDCK